ncbi:MAG: hypothetical protein C4520_14640 [Candidatus Abyssobacteria bacterium SURF_5]|uniref:Uncharacterized protein n=1 Tax=Abyssobacteria bacterium (strain SURF_5) TaxID=2093360 RepID=A0A3A4NS19_ABYX5|nr:MAG: hypothetical protein C4520_14640 [Candidatus Abyssubacteria bacterium SURF_5]
MNVVPVIVGLAVGIAAAAMDFSLAKSIASLIRPSTIRYGQAIVLGGFVFRFGFIGLLLWTLSRASNVNFVAACIGLVGTFTVLTIVQMFRTLGGIRQQKQASDRR